MKFYNARMTSELTRQGDRFLFVIWNLFAFLVSSALLCAVSLNFAVGTYDWAIYIGYFKHPFIFLLNWIPVLFLQLVFMVLFNRQWLAFFTNSLFTMLPAIGNFYKIKFRSEPFVFSDIPSIRAALGVADNYEITLNTRLVISVLFMGVMTLFLLLFARGRMRKISRILSVILPAAASFLLWKFIFSDNTLYHELAEKNKYLVTWDSREDYIATGFPYPFIHSITASADIAPEGYTEEEAVNELTKFESRDIPADKRVNIMVLQLESFADLEAMGLQGVSEKVYAPWRILEKESLTGIMIPNVIGGGTIDTERCFLCGTYGQQNYYHDAYSYIRYLNTQGYYTVGSHPNRSFYYGRESVSNYLGFEDYYFLENYFYEVTGGEWQCDKDYLPEVFHMLLDDAAEGKNVFSFNVSLQGHGAYDSDYLYSDDSYWNGKNASDATRITVNNYLSLITETQQILLDQINAIRNVEVPVVLLIYGDHKPWFGDSMYAELGVRIHTDNEKGMIDYLGTPYLIWANEAAKEIIENDFIGGLPMVSPGYMMNVLFDVLGWRGPQFMQYTSSVMEHLPVVCTK